MSESELSLNDYSYFLKEVHTRNARKGFVIYFTVFTKSHPYLRKPVKSEGFQLNPFCKAQLNMQSETYPVIKNINVPTIESLYVIC